MMKLISTSDIPLIERIRLEDEFFSQPFIMSYSGLNKLMFSPALFYNHYILKQRDDVVEKPMVEGKLLHCLLLNPEEFDKEFVLMSSAMPSENPRKILDRLYKHLNEAYPEITGLDTLEYLSKLGNVENAILDLLKDHNLYQSLKTDQQRLDKMFTEVNIKYLDYLYQSKKKTVVDQEMYDFAKGVVEKIKSDSKINALMGAYQDSLEVNTKVFNELDLVMMEFDEYSFGIRGIIDNLVVDHDSKVIRVNDLKKSGKSISTFKDSIEYFGYWMQAALYVRLINNIKSTTFGVDYPVEFRFIVVDPYMQIAPIKINEQTIEEWSIKLDDMLNKAEFHLNKKDFSLPYEFLQETEYAI